MTVQSMEALSLANEVRLRRAAVRREIGLLPARESRLRASEVVDDPEPELEGMTVRRLVSAVRGLGPHGTRCLLIKARVSDTTTLAGLTDRQRSALMEELL